MKKLIVNLCPTGMITNKSMTPFVPQSPEEIISDVLKCAELGITMVHIHACDEFFQPTYKKEYTGKIIEGIRSVRPDLILIASTSGRLLNEFDKRSEVLDLEGIQKPDMASLTLSSLNFSKTASVNTPEMIVSLAKKMLDNGIKPELEVFDAGMVNYAHYLIKKGLLEPPYYFNIILGNIATAQPKMQSLSLLMSELPQNSIFSVGGVGVCQRNMNVLGMLFANGIRIGLEDNIWFNDAKTIPATNYDLVNRAIQVAHALECEIMSSHELRELLNIKNLNFVV